LTFVGFMITHVLLLQPSFLHVHNILLLVARTLFMDLYPLVDFHKSYNHYVHFSLL
jgi:hypothetical protein